MRLAPESPLTTHYERTKERMGWAKAQVATGQKPARVIHRMLKTGEVWRESRPVERAEDRGKLGKPLRQDLPVQTDRLTD